MNNHTVVSFCIPTYNRATMVEELVQHILSSENPFIEVVVMDNCSTDNTLKILRTINDNRLKIYSHLDPVSAFQSWYDTLNKAEGDWIFHVNDRDWINASMIDLLVDTLQELDSQNVGFAVAGDKLSTSNKYVLYNEGMDTLREFALLFSHPTGQIISKEMWDSLPNKQEFFSQTDRYGYYPHGYLYALIGNHKKGAYISFDICDIAHYNERLCRTRSAIRLDNPDQKEWFWPESRFKLLTLAAENLDLIEDSSLHKEFILNRYYQFFFCVTQEWHSTCNNALLKMRYNRPDLETNYLNLMVNGFDYIILFREYLENHDFAWADDNFYEVLAQIDQKLIAWLLPWTNNLRKCDS